MQHTIQGWGPDHEAYCPEPAWLRRGRAGDAAPLSARVAPFPAGIKVTGAEMAELNIAYGAHHGGACEVQGGGKNGSVRA